MTRLMQLVTKTQGKVHISGTGSYLPLKKLGNQELSAKLGVSPEWIVQRTGILQRSVASPEQATSDLAVEAARQAIVSSRLRISDLDVIITATSTPDVFVPSTASFVKDKLQADSVCVFDLGAACSGFIYGLVTACAYLQSDLAANVLLVAAETRTRFVNYKDPDTAVLYGDGAGAVIVSSTEKSNTGILQITTGSEVNGKIPISIPAGGSRLPASHATVDKDLHYIAIEGRSIMNSAVRYLARLVEDSLDRAGITKEEIDWIVPHQMNLRILKSLAAKTGIPLEKFYINIDQCGNTSAASIPIALDQAVRNHRIQSGHLVLLIAFGAGCTWGSVLMRW